LISFSPLSIALDLRRTANITQEPLRRLLELIPSLPRRTRCFCYNSGQARTSHPQLRSVQEKGRYVAGGKSNAQECFEVSNGRLSLRFGEFTSSLASFALDSLTSTNASHNSLVRLSRSITFISLNSTYRKLSSNLLELLRSTFRSLRFGCSRSTKPLRNLRIKRKVFHQLR